MDVIICLTMIVKNECKIMERCLNSAKPIIDFVCISDTGSTDGTPDIISKWCNLNNIPFKIHYDKFLNFGYNRTKSFEHSIECFPQANYLLLLDADMVVVVNPRFNKKDLNAPSYSIIQYNGGLQYYNTRLIRSNLPWKCHGVLHEYWGCSGIDQDQQLDTLTINDLNDNRCSNYIDKYNWYLQLLKDGLKDETTPSFLRTRYYFYYAETERVLGNWLSAIEYYHKRIEAGSWAEEVFYSLYQIGNCYHRLYKMITKEGDDQQKEIYFSQSIRYHLEAFNHTQRPEPLFKLSRIYRKNSKFYLSYMMAKSAKKLPETKSILFLDNRMDYRLDYEISIDAYYLNKYDIGRQVSDQLLYNFHIPDHYRNSVHLNYLFYLLQPNFKCHQIKSNFPKKFNPMNPSIVKMDQGYIVNVRLVNFKLINNQYITDNNENIINRNIVLTLDKNFKIKNQRELRYSVQPKYNHHEIGLTDCRLILINDTLKHFYFISNSYNYYPEDMLKIYLGHFQYKSDKPLQVLSLNMLQGPDSNKVEKNWLPFIPYKEPSHEDNLLPFYIMYSYSPLIIYQPRTDGTLKEIINNDLGLNLSLFRGSAGPIPFDNGYLVVIHEVIFKDTRFYTHRFVWFNQQFNKIKCSHLFIFRQKGIEYCAGMCYNHSGDTILLTAGLNDSSAWIFSLPVTDIASMLHPLSIDK